MNSRYWTGSIWIPIAIDDENQKTEKRNRCMKTIVLTGILLKMANRATLVRF
jgi:hypothetical protein